MAGVDSAGPIFISHRGSDGTELAIRLARLLRASGVPVWLDVDDLPPGDIASRLDDALSKGLSGAVIIVTPQVGESAVIRHQELPALLALARADSDFTFAILNEVPEPTMPNEPERAAPARLLDPDEDHPDLHASPGVKQFSSIDKTDVDLARWLGRRRLEVLRRGRETESLTLDAHTRLAASAYGSRADLAFRSTPPATGARIPEPEVWDDIARLLRWLPDALVNAHPPQIVVSGAGHLGVGLVLGAGLPETTGLPIAVATNDGVFERSKRSPGWRDRLPAFGILPKETVVAAGSGRPVAVHVDIAELPGQDTFVEWAVAHPTEFSTAVALRKTRRFTADQGGMLATFVASRIRDLARRAGTTEVLLFPHTAWPVAVLIGTLLNTLNVRIFEWDDGRGTPAYREVATVRPGVGGGALIEVARR